MAETQRYERPTFAVHQGEDAREARIRLARGLLEGVGATKEVAEAGAGDAADDPHFLDDVVASLVDDGVVALSRLPDRRASEEQLDRSLLGPAFASALDRRRGLPAGPRERARLGRLYSLAGESEKAASCYREVLDDRGPVPLSLVLETALAASRSGEKALALGAVDRVAEVVLTGETGQDKSPEDATVAGTALERAAELALTLGAAPRAAALARAAVLIFERAGLKRESQRTLGSLGKALLANGDRPGARSTFERFRALAAASGELALAARALEVAGEAFLGLGDVEVAADWLEQASDARSAAGEKAAAARAALRAADLRCGRGDLGAAGVAYERARAYSGSAKDPLLGARVSVALARARVAEGQLGPAIAEAQDALEVRERENDLAGAAEARIALAHALLVAGDVEAAQKALSAARDDAAGAAAARALELRAEILALEGRGEDADALLADAARAHAAEKSDTDAARAQVRRAELWLAAKDEARARARFATLASLRGAESPELVARVALLDATLAEAEDVRAKALDRAFDVAYSKDFHAPRVAAGVARARARLAAGKPELAAADVRAALEALRDARKSLPEARRQAFLTAPARRDATALGQSVREALAQRKAARDAGTGAPDETAGLESALGALEVLLGVLVPA